MGSLSVVPMLLKHRIDKSGRSAIIIRIYKNSKVMHDDKTGKKIEPAFWDEEKRQVKKTAPNAALINALINRRKSELETEFLKKELHQLPVTKNVIKLLARGQDPGKDFLQYCRDRIPERYADPKQSETRRTYIGEVNKLEEFQQNVSFGDIDPHFLSRYKAWLINKRGNAENTVWKTFKFLNTMLNDAINGKVIRENPFDSFNRGVYKQGKRSYLDISDCDKIHELLLTDIPDRLRFVGIYYLFMCYTGFRFQDAVSRFDPAVHIINDQRIIIDTQKCDVEVNILIHDRLRSLLEFIKSNPLKMSNKEFNDYLKILAVMAKIDINLTAHVGRHTFGATLAELDVPIKTAQKLLGHKDMRSTEIYFHIKNKNVDKEMLKWNSLL